MGCRRFLSWRGLGLLIVCGTLLEAIPAAAGAATTCPLSIIKCGCIIKTAGSYTVASDLFATQGLTPHGACIEIKADHTVVQLNGHTISGDGSGTGLLILKSADHSLIEGAIPGDNSTQAVVTDWNVGIEDDASNSVVELFKSIDTNASGILLNSVSNSLVDGAVIGNNSVAGISVQGGGNNRLANFTVQSNQLGVWLNFSNHNTLTAFTAVNNQNNGVWILSSDQNSIYDSGQDTNGNGGIVFGCGPNPPASINCNKKPSNDNHVSVSGANDNTGPGILIDKRSQNNTISNTKDQGNGGSGDVADDNPSCGTNVWTNNTFGSANQGCIH